MVDILLIVPEDELAADLSEEFGARGWSVRVQSSGKDVEKVFEEHRPSLVVLDLATDGGQGLETCHRLRKLPRAEMVPVLLIGSGESGITTFGDALAEGADYYFPKPVDTGHLSSKIATYIGTAIRKPQDTKGQDKPEPKNIAARVDMMFELGQTIRGEEETESQDSTSDEKNVTGGATNRQAPGPDKQQAPASSLKISPPTSDDESADADEVAKNIETIMGQLAQELDLVQQPPEPLDDLLSDGEHPSGILAGTKRIETALGGPEPEENEQRQEKEAISRSEEQERTRREEEERRRREEQERRRREEQERKRREEEERKRREEEER
ncbi:MAG: response regulator, partial [Deltaproteobacteria bacterium]